MFDGCLAVSVLAVAVGGGPLWLQMLRTARRRREQAWLLTPAVVAAVFLLVAFAVGHLVGRAGPIVVPSQLGQVADLASGGVGPWWFLALVVLGFAAALLSAAGPALALRRLRPEGPVVVRAARAAALAAGTMSLACAVSVVAVIGLYLWAPATPGYHESWELAVYLPAVLLAGAVAVVSAARGLRPPGRPPRPDQARARTQEEHGDGRADHGAGDRGASGSDRGEAAFRFGIATAARDVGIAVGIVLGLLYLFPVLSSVSNRVRAVRGGTGARGTWPRSRPG